MMFLGNYLHVARALGMNVEKNEKSIVFINFVRGDRTFDYFTKNAIGHEFNYILFCGHIDLFCCSVSVGPDLRLSASLSKKGPLPWLNVQKATYGASPLP